MLSLNSHTRKKLKTKNFAPRDEGSNFFYIMNYRGFFPSYVVDATHYYAVDIFGKEAVDVV